MFLEKKEDEIPSGLNTKGLNKSFCEIPVNDARKDPLHSSENPKAADVTMKSLSGISHEVPKAAGNEESHKMTENRSRSDLPEKRYECEFSAEINAATMPQGVSETGVRKHILLTSPEKDTGELNQILSEAANGNARPDILPSAMNPESEENGSTYMLPEEKAEHFTLGLNDKGLGGMPLLAFENQNLKYLLLHNNEIKNIAFKYR